MVCPTNCAPPGKYEPTEVTIAQIRMRLHDTDPNNYAFSDDEIKMRIDDAIITGSMTFGVVIDDKTGWPATKIDWLITSLLTCKGLLQSFAIRLGGTGAGSSGGASTSECSGGGSFTHLAFIDSLSEGGSSISFASIGDIQGVVDKITEEIEQLKISRWGCALYVSTGNY